MTKIYRFVCCYEVISIVKTFPTNYKISNLIFKSNILFKYYKKLLRKPFEKLKIIYEVRISFVIYRNMYL